MLFYFVSFQLPSWAKPLSAIRTLQRRLQNTVLNFRGQIPKNFMQELLPNMVKTSFMSKSVSTGQFLPSQFSYLVWRLSELVFSISDLKDNLDAERVYFLRPLDHIHTPRSLGDKNGH